MDILFARLPSKVIPSTIATGQRFQGQFLSISALATTTPFCRIAIVVGTKVHKHAAARNRMKRLIREATRAIVNKMVRGCDVVIFVRKDFHTIPFVQVEQELTALLVS